MDPYLGEIRIFAGTYAPVNWNFCDGKLYPIDQNQALYSLIGVIYGGDGKTTFGVPNLNGRVPIHKGQGAGLTINHALGSSGGTETVTLTTAQVPAHTHVMNATSSAGTSESPTGAELGSLSGKATQFVTSAATGLAAFTMSTSMVGNTGGNQPHDNMMPTTGINFIIAMNGIFPYNGN